jgi:hypothetical protein
LQRGREVDGKCDEDSTEEEESEESSEEDDDELAEELERGREFKENDRNCLDFKAIR